MHINVDLLAADVLSIQVLLEDLAHLYDGTDLTPIEISSWSMREEPESEKTHETRIENTG